MPTRYAPLALLFLLAAGCSTHQSPVTPGTSAALLPSGDAPPPSLQAGESLSELFTVSVNPSSLSGEVAASGRSATAQPPQALNYDIDIAKFLKPEHFRVSSVGLDASNNLIVTIQFRHPFPAPDFALPITVVNRADLGFTGRLLILTPNSNAELDIPGEGLYKWDSTYLSDPDGYVEVGDLLRTTGLENNLFPYFLLADEAKDNRLGVSNGGDPLGTYDAPGGGWQVANAGANRDDWTGYDYIHQGQITETQVVINYSEVRFDPFEFDIAILAKYTAPKGSPGPPDRFPVEPVDVSRFAYRLPFAAMDVSQCSWCNRLDVMGSPTTTKVAVNLRDWDYGATEAADADLSDESDVSLIQPTAAAAPVLEMVQPDLFPTPRAIPLVGGTGLPGDELRYRLTFTNDSGYEGEGWMFFRASDPETSDPSFVDYHFGLDPNTVLPDAARAIKSRTFMPVKFRSWSSSSWIRFHDAGGVTQSGSRFNLTPDGRLLYTLSYVDPLNDMDPAPCIQSVPVGGESDHALVELDADGHLINRWVWTDPTLVNSSAAAQDAAGNTYCAFTFNASFNNDGPVSMDLDPGPGTDTHSGTKTLGALVKLDAGGNYAWGKHWGESIWMGTFGWAYGGYVNSVRVAPGGNICVTGTYCTSIDLDPGPGVYELTCGSNGYGMYIAVYSPDGTWLWGWGGGDHNQMLPPTFRANGNIVLAGYFGTDYDFDPGPGQTILDHGYSLAAFRAEYTPAGGLVAASRMRTIGAAQGYLELFEFTQCPDGHEWGVGLFSGDVDLDPGPGVAQYTSNYTSDRTFIVRFASNNTLEWSGTYEMPDPDSWAYATRGAVADSAGGLLITGDVPQGLTFDLDPGAGVSNVDGGTGTYGESYWTRLTPSGTLDWVRHFPQQSFVADLLMMPGDRPLFSYNYFRQQQIDAGHTFVNTTAQPVFLKLQPDGSW